MKNFTELGDQLHNHAISGEGDAICPAFASRDKLNCVEGESLHQNDQFEPRGPPQLGNGGVGQESDEQRCPKRMRIDSEGEHNDNLAQDLTL